MSRGKIEALYLHFLKTYKYHTWQSGDLSGGAQFTQLHISLIVWSHDVTWQNKTCWEASIYRKSHIFLIIWLRNVTWKNKNIIFPVPQDLSASILGEWWVRLRSFHYPSHSSLWSSGHLISSDKINTLYLHFHKIDKHQTWQRGYLGLGTLTRKVTPLITLSIDLTWQIRNVTSPLSQDLLPTILAGWWPSLMVS